MAELDSPITLASTPVLMSIRRFAEEFQLGRDTVSKRLAQFNVRPAGERNGHPVYRLRDAAQAILGVGLSNLSDGFDPSTLPPDQRNAWYMSEHRRMSLEAMQGTLIPAIQVEADFATLVMDLTQFLETLPDVMERDVALTPEQVQAMHDSIDRARETLYKTVTARGDVSEVEVSNA